MTQHTGFLLGIGSNINPKTNLVAVIEQLLYYFPRLTLSRVLRIPPIGMNSQHDFLNVVVFIETKMNADALKEICNDIETKQGRDRTDPERKTKDRPADLDILKAVHYPRDYDIPAHSITDEYFLYPLIDELVATLAGKAGSAKQDGIALTHGNLSFGQTATTIDRQTDTRDKWVI